MLMNQLKSLFCGNVKTCPLGHCRVPDGDEKSDCHLTRGKPKEEVNIVVCSPLLDLIFGIPRGRCQDPEIDSSLSLSAQILFSSFNYLKTSLRNRFQVAIHQWGVHASGVRSGSGPLLPHRVQAVRGGLKTVMKIALPALVTAPQSRWTPRPVAHLTPPFLIQKVSCL